MSASDSEANFGRHGNTRFSNSSSGINLPVRYSSLPNKIGFQNGVDYDDIDENDNEKIRGKVKTGRQRRS